MNAKKLGAVLAAVSASSLLSAADYTLTPKDASGVVTISVGEGASHTMDSADIAAILASGVTKFAKTGAGTLVGGDIGTFAGEIAVEGGVYQVAAISSLGTVDGKTTVADGAMLELTAKFSLKSEPMEISGTGVGGKGAIWADSTAGDITVGELKLADNARIQSETASVTFDNSGTFDMQHLELTVCSKGGNTNWNRKSNTTNPGTIVNERHQFWLGWSGSMTDGDPEKGWGKIVIGGTNADSSISFWERTMAEGRNNWTIVFRNPNTSSGVCVYKAGTCWYGPVEIESDAKGLFSNNGGTLRLYGPISGSGNATIKCVTHLHGTNTWAGTVSLWATVYAMNEKSVPEDKLATISDALRFAARTDELAAIGEGYTAAKLMEIITARKDTLKTQIFVDKDQTFDFDQRFTETIAKAIAVTGTGRCRFIGGFANSAGITLTGRTADTVLEAGSSASRDTVGAVTVSDGRVTMSNFYGIATGSLTVSGSTAGTDSSKLTLADSVWTNPGNNKFLVIANDTTARGVVEMKSGAVVSNGVSIASGQNSCAAVYQRDGSAFCAMGGGGHDGAYGVGSGSLAYHELVEGAKFAINPFVCFGSGENAVGMMYQKGGSSTASTEWFYLAQRGRGIWYQTGGTSYFGNGGHGVRCCCLNYSGINKGADAQFIVTGEGTKLTLGGPLEMCDRYDSTTSLNILSGGTFEGTDVIMLRFRSYASPKTTLAFTNQFGYVNFNGGVYRPFWYNNELFGTATGSTLPDKSLTPSFPTRITVFQRGAVFNVDKHGASAWNRVSAPIERIPDGGGSITAIRLPTDMEKTGYIAPPYVEVKGRGTNAIAVAEFDSYSGTVTGITVVSPGWGYGSDTTVVLSRGGKTTSVTLTSDDLTIETLKSGGLTMRGTGTLKLAATNTYEGVTRVEGGTLLAECDWAIPDGTEVVLAGGNLNFNGKKANVSKVTYAVGGGSLKNAGNATLPATFGLTISASEVFGGKSIALAGDMDLSSSTLTLTGEYAALDENVRRYTVAKTSGSFTGKPAVAGSVLPKGWVVRTTHSKIELSFTRGFLVLIR